MLPTYPLICALITEESPEESVVEQRAQNGRIRVYDLGEYSDHRATLVHYMVKRDTVDQVLNFWRANRRTLFNLETELGDRWTAAFRRRPNPVREQDHGPWYDLHVDLILYDPREGGL